MSHRVAVGAVATALLAGEACAMVPLSTERFVSVLYREYAPDTTFGEWMAQHQTTLSGDPLPEHNQRYYVCHPHENDLYWRMIAANQMSYAKSLSIAIYEPAKAAFGSGLKCGEWAQYSNGRTFAAEVRPRLMNYWKNGVFGLDFQIPAYYPQGLTTWEGGFDSPIPFGDTDPGWHLVPNWRERLQGLPSTPGDLLFEASLQQQSAVDWGAARSSDKTLFPSTSVEFLLKLNDYPTYQRVLWDRLLRTILDGARDIWMFEPRFNLPSPPDPNAPTDPPNPDDLRKAVYEVVIAVNSRVEAMKIHRSRVARAGHVSQAFLGVNRP